jgi:N-acetyl-1-D-myo-inositol-2-amino-2-deoxy-alpha-D-glucopyranoside deacetylase
MTDEKIDSTTARPILLAVLAHPDDETFGMGGTLAHYVKRGVEVHLVCATKGELGEMPPELMEGFNSVAEVRVHELSCAADILGIKEIHYMGYRDSGMPGSPENQHPDALFAQPVEKVAVQVAHLIREIKPQVVLTFDPIGGYRHPDHIAIHKATVLAFQMAGDPQASTDDPLPAYQSQRLFYNTISRRMLRISVRILKLLGKDPHHFGTNHDIDIESLAIEDFPTNAVISYRDVSLIRDRAAACYESQGGKSMTMGVQAWIRRWIGSSETYMQGYPVPAPKKPVKDLFAGVEIR